MTKKPPLNPDVEMLQWGPIPINFIYGSVYLKGMLVDAPRKYKGVCWPDGLLLLKNQRGIWFNELPAIQAAGRKAFLKYILPPASRRAIKKEYQQTIKKIFKECKKIDNTDLTKISNEQLASTYNDFFKHFMNFFITTVPAELGNYGSAKLLEEKLQEHIEDASELRLAMEALTAPEELSFYQLEELDLLHSKDLAKHRQKYSWLQNSYAGPKHLSKEFFARRQKELEPGLEKKIEDQLATARKKKKAVIKKHKLPNEVVQIAAALSEAVAWQDDRKKYIFIAVSYKGMLIKEIAKRFGYTLKELHNTWFWEVSDIMKGKDIHSALKKRTNGFGIIMGDELKEIDSKQADEYWKLYQQKPVDKNTKSFSGIIASQGKGKTVKGKVHILLDPHATDTFKEGDILVAPMTSPEYVFAMKKAAAVITDTGGLTSHAAIVSRELNIPCLVNTKIATQVLKDGDEVEVDAGKGVVTKL